MFKKKNLSFYYNYLTINKSIEKNCQVFSNREFLKVGKWVFPVKTYLLFIFSQKMT